MRRHITSKEAKRLKAHSEPMSELMRPVRFSVFLVSPASSSPHLTGVLFVAEAESDPSIPVATSIPATSTPAPSAASAGTGVVTPEGPRVEPSPALDSGAPTKRRRRACLRMSWERRLSFRTKRRAVV